MTTTPLLVTIMHLVTIFAAVGAALSSGFPVSPVKPRGANGADLD